jgi:AcrR family transcriptional regulator
MADSDRSYPSVWTRPPRKERSTLTREQIVSEAVRLLDSEGIDALSMRKLAARLEAGATSIYWHVANRDELIELIIDEVYGELEVPDPDGTPDWRPAVRRVAHDMRSGIVRHPWIVSVLDHLAAVHMGPNALRLSERLIGLFQGAGFELREAERALTTLSSYVIGSAMAEAAFRNWLARHGQSEQDWLVESQRQWQAQQATENHPRLGELVAGYEGADVQKNMDEDFEYGLDCVLDGLQARLDRPSPSP